MSPSRCLICEDPSFKAKESLATTAPPPDFRYSLYLKINRFRLSMLSYRDIKLFSVVDVIQNVDLFNVATPIGTFLAKFHVQKHRQLASHSAQKDPVN